MYAEEDYLYDKFNDEFINWSTKPSAILPNFSGLIKPDGVFSFKRIIKREYSTICGIGYMFIVIISSTYFGILSITLEIFCCSLYAGIITAIEFFLYNLYQQKN